MTRMRAARRKAHLAAPVTALAVLSGCGDGGVSSTAPAAPGTPAPPPPCAGVSITFSGPGDSAGIARGALSLEASDPSVALDFVRPYTIEVPEGGANLDVPGLRPTIGVFVSDLSFTPLGDGFRQTMTIEWISGLEIRVSGENCEPVSVSCDLRGCAGS